jgi:hypothetical protein
MINSPFTGSHNLKSPRSIFRNEEGTKKIIVMEMLLNKP